MGAEQVRYTAMATELNKLRSSIVELKGEVQQLTAYNDKLKTQLDGGGKAAIGAAAGMDKYVASLRRAAEARPKQLFGMFGQNEGQTLSQYAATIEGRVQAERRGKQATEELWASLTASWDRANQQRVASMRAANQSIADNMTSLMGRSTSMMPMMGQSRMNFGGVNRSYVPAFDRGIMDRSQSDRQLHEMLSNRGSIADQIFDVGDALEGRGRGGRGGASDGGAGGHMMGSRSRLVMGVHDLSMAISGVGGMRYVLFGINDILLNCGIQFGGATLAAVALGTVGLSVSEKLYEGFKEWRTQLVLSGESIDALANKGEALQNRFVEMRKALRDFNETQREAREASFLKGYSEERHEKAEERSQSIKKYFQLHPESRKLAEEQFARRAVTSQTRAEEKGLDVADAALQTSMAEYAKLHGFPAGALAEKVAAPEQLYGITTTEEVEAEQKRGHYGRMGGYDETEVMFVKKRLELRNKRIELQRKKIQAQQEGLQDLEKSVARGDVSGIAAMPGYLVPGQTSPEVPRGIPGMAEEVGGIEKGRKALTTKFDEEVRTREDAERQVSQQAEETQRAAKALSDKSALIREGVSISRMRGAARTRALAARREAGLPDIEVSRTKRAQSEAEAKAMMLDEEHRKLNEAQRLRQEAMEQRFPRRTAKEQEDIRKLQQQGLESVTGFEGHQEGGVVGDGSAPGPRDKIPILAERGERVLSKREVATAERIARGEAKQAERAARVAIAIERRSTSDGGLSSGLLWGTTGPPGTGQWGGVGGVTVDEMRRAIPAAPTINQSRKDLLFGASGGPRTGQWGGVGGPMLGEVLRAARQSRPEAGSFRGGIANAVSGADESRFVGGGRQLGPLTWEQQLAKNIHDRQQKLLGRQSPQAGTGGGRAIGGSAIGPLLEHEYRSGASPSTGTSPLPSIRRFEEIEELRRQSGLLQGIHGKMGSGTVNRDAQL